jgi:hypothetical protein
MSKDIVETLRECQRFYLSRPVVTGAALPKMAEMGPAEALYTADQFAAAIEEIERLRAGRGITMPKGVLHAVVTDGPNKGRTLGECLMHGLYVEQSTKWGRIPD